MTAHSMLTTRPLLFSLGLLIQFSAAFEAVAAPAKPATRSPTALNAQPIVVVRPQLKNDVMLTRDIVTFGDLIAGLRPSDASLPAFRAPALGETGTIQAHRIIEAAVANNVLADSAEIDQRGIGQVIVSRAARRLSAMDIENAVKLALAERHNVDGRSMALVFDGGAPNLVVEPDLTAALTVQDVTYDARAKRVNAVMTLPGSASLRLKPVRITGQLVETVDVVVPLRAVARGETLAAADVTIERRPREGLGPDMVADIPLAIGRVARRSLAVGLPLRTQDIQRQEIVGRGDVITIVYEAPGVQLSLRGRANEAGAMGDSVAVMNPNSKRVLQGTVTGPGRVSVNTTTTSGRVAVAQ
jgi:flagellar basal body P-ring formation protein FlgA